MKKKYTNQLLKMFPDIASGRKNFKYFESRIRKKIILTNKYFKKKNGSW